MSKFNQLLEDNEGATINIQRYAKAAVGINLCTTKHHVVIHLLILTDNNRRLSAKEIPILKQVSDLNGVLNGMITHGITKGLIDTITTFHCFSGLYFCNSFVDHGCDRANCL